MRFLLTLLAIVCIASSPLAASLAVGAFSSGDLSGWEDQTFRGKAKTTYGIVQDGGKMVLKAESNASASGLIRKLEIDTKQHPILRWSWKIEHTLKKGDETRKDGDDYAARVYIVFPRTIFWKTRAINYIWANRLPKGEHIPNSYSANVMMVAVESGNSQAGKWLTEERNIFEDYRKFFGEEPPLLGAVAIMTDSDNTGDQATAWYGDILLGNRQGRLSAPGYE